MTHQCEAAVFPGQGSQTVGMAKNLFKQFPKAKETFVEAEDSCHLFISRLCLQADEKDLQKTSNQQPCILTMSVAIWRILQAETVWRPRYFAGHSLGEYSALVAANKIAFSKAVSLVHKRGLFMQEAVPQGLGAMTAVLACDLDFLAALCHKTQEKLGLAIAIANYNSEKQLIVSGHLQAVVELENALQTKKIRTVRLPVSAPFHSSLMRPARKAMEPYLANLEFEQNSAKVYANVSGEIADPYLSQHLIEQIDQPVLWLQTMKNLQAEKISRLIEVGPGRVLYSLALRSLPRSVTCMNSLDLQALIASLSI